MNAREKDLLKHVGKLVIWKDIVVTGGSAEYKKIVSTCVGYSLDRGLLIVAAPAGQGHELLDPVFDVVVYPRERYLFVNPNNVYIL